MAYRSIRLTAVAFCSLGSAAWHAPVAFAADAAPSADSESLGEIVVTAQRREEKSRDVPISITALSSDQLATANVQSLSDTSKLTPGLRFDTQGPAMQPTIRGVGTAITTSGGGPNVGIYVDGFFRPNTYAADFQLMNTESIQVLKGPQGTLFGRNTTGGAILVTTADPSFESSGQIKVTYARFNSPEVQLYGTTGLTDKIAVDVEGMFKRGDGYFNNIATNDDKAGEYQDWTVRTGIKVQFTDDVSLLLRYEHSNINDPTTQDVNAYVDPGTANFYSTVSNPQASYGRTSSAGQPLVNLNAPPSSYTTVPGLLNLTSPVGFTVKSDVVQATVKADLGFANLTSYTQYRHEHTPYYGDLDVTTVPLFDILVDVSDETYSQEFVLNSKAGSALQWTAGFNYFQYTDTWAPIKAEGEVPGSLNNFISFGGSSTKTKSLAGFGDATYEFVPNEWFLTVGARYSHDEVTDAYFITDGFSPYTGYTGPDGQNIPFTGKVGDAIPVHDLTHNSVTPRVVLRFKPDDPSSIYASYARGYKAGILNVGGDSQEPVKPETNDAFEVGYKYEQGKFAVDLATFLYNYKDLQVSSYQNGQAQITNAASARIYGVEGQIRYNLFSALDLNAGAAYTHARYRDFQGAPFYGYCDPAAAYPALNACTSGKGSIVETQTNASGDHMQRSPDFTANVGAAYHIPLNAFGTFTMSGNAYYTSSFYFDPEQQFKQDGYTVVSLRGQWDDSSRKYFVAVFGDNVTDRRFQTQVLFNTLGIGSVWNSPAIFGLQVGAKF